MGSLWVLQLPKLACLKLLYVTRILARVSGHIIISNLLVRNVMKNLAVILACVLDGSGGSPVPRSTPPN